MTSREQELWDAEAATFDNEPDHGLHDPDVRDAWRSLLISLLPPAPARVADLGCGTGTLSLLMAEEGHAVDGVDLSPEMLRRAVAKAGSYPGTSFVVGDAGDPPLPAATYDVVLCRHVLWALPDPAAALARWIDLLLPDGRLVLIEGQLVDRGRAESRGDLEAAHRRRPGAARRAPARPGLLGRSDR